MSVIYKYPLFTDAKARVDMPQGARVVRVATQHGAPTLWALVPAANTELATEPRWFRIVGTGRVCDGEYVGTCDIGAFVWHVFEVSS